MASRGVSSSSATWTTVTSPSATTTLNQISSSGINGYYTEFGNSSDFGNFSASGAFEILMTGLQESKIIEILDSIIQNIPSAEFRRLVRSTVRVRHFSEDFLMKYIDYLNNDDLFEQHKENIKSKEYATLALYLETKEKK